MSRLDIVRRREGRKFVYYRDNRQIKKQETLNQIKALGIPPAWTGVVIASSPSAKVRAQGVDKAGRIQAIYNPKFRAKQEKHKHQRILGFAAQLPQLRQQIERDLAMPDLPKEKVLACIVKLIDIGYFRVGNEEYAKENDSYGITTMRSKHVDVTNYSVTFDFMGKSGKHHVKKINDRTIARIIKQLDEMPGYEIFRYKDEAGALHNISSRDVNDYIKTHMGADFTAKDFRTWGGTLLAIDLLAAEAIRQTEKERQKAVSACVQQVAHRLGNTPAIARASYINPHVFKRYLKGEDFNEIRRTIAGLRRQKYITEPEHCALKILETKA